MIFHYTYVPNSEWWHTVNDLVDSAAIKIKDIIEGERCRKTAMQEVLKQILEEAENLA